MRAIQITEFGGPEVLKTAEVPDPQPTGDDILIHVDRSGVNYADTHQTENTYLTEVTLPMTPGGEVIGRTPDGRRVAALVGTGGYAEQATADPNLVFDVPDGVDDVSALALLIQGTTAWVLLRKSIRMEPDESIVVHAAAGGVGSIAVQLAKVFGAGRVIATASSEEKRELATRLGADATVDSRAEDMTTALIEANGGRPVDAVLDMTGGRITDESMRALAPFGRLAFYGMASQEEPSPVKPRTLMRHSTGISGMWLAHAFTLPGNVVHRAMGELFDMVRQGTLRTVNGGVYPLSEARRAHEDLRGRRSTGKLALDPAN
ncbi:quinone oxidoreductase family protein [Halostreptopolyspora alba]|uniref:NADPH:quinone oxidoreductase family protein n=1 Tax=Halostreptopolyspora alba TaxID=2487137 RepID=A0A3N0E9T2_9ACTN|nr:NADPH:quinone oxidoreductase family protein [Nocardiopsaceae bacterium YIM 96095]